MLNAISAPTVEPDLTRCQVDKKKVHWAVIRPWIAKKLVELIGFEDEIIIEYAMELLEDSPEQVSHHFFLYLMAYTGRVDVGPEAYPDKPDWFPRQKHPGIYERPLEPAPRGSKRNHWRAADVP